MNGLRSGSTSNEVKYPANCATRLSVEANHVDQSSLAIENSNLDKLYETKPNKKIVRIITVIAYIFSVSMIAILLSLYYLFLWDPYIKYHKAQQQHDKLKENQWKEGFDEGVQAYSGQDPGAFLHDGGDDEGFPRALALSVRQHQAAPKSSSTQYPPMMISFMTTATTIPATSEASPRAPVKPTKVLKTLMARMVMENPFSSYAKAKLRQENRLVVEKKVKKKQQQQQQVVVARPSLHFQHSEKGL